MKHDNKIKDLLKKAPVVFESGFPVRDFTIYDNRYLVMLGISRPQEEDIN